MNILKKLKSVRMFLLVTLIIGIFIPVGSTIVMTNFAIQQLGNKAEYITDENMTKEIKQRLKFTVDSVKTQTETEYALLKDTIPEDVLFEKIRLELDGIKFGENGYFFAYDMNGVRLVAPENRSQEFKNMIDVTDSKGNKVIKLVLDSSKKDGFFEYYWKNPQTGNEEKKLSYSIPVTLGNRTIVIGTGTYLNALDEAKLEVGNSIDNSQQQLMLKVILISVILTLIIVVVTIVLIGRFIIKPIQMTAEHMKEVSEGNLSMKSENGFYWEFSTLEHGLNELVNNTAVVVRKILDTSETLKNNIVEIKSSAIESTQGSQQVADAIAQVAIGVQESSNSITNVSNVASNSNESMKVLNQNIDKMSSNTNQSVKSTNEGKQDIDKLVKQMQNTFSESQIVNDTMKTLEDKMNEVTKITEVITSIAKQTNLLALNAAIEAARAGDAGRGFAVVADEVRKLAEASDNQSKEISHIVRKVIDEVANAIDSTTKINSMINDSEKASTNVKDKFNEIYNYAESSYELIKTINKETLDVAMKMDSLTGNISEMVAISEQSATSAEEITASSQEISASMQMIQSQINNVSEQVDELINSTKVFKI